jgi:hypothetical protein
MIPQDIAAMLIQLTKEIKENSFVTNATMVAMTSHTKGMNS